MFTTLRNFVAAKSGATALEFALIASWVSVAIVLAVAGYGK